MATVTFTNSTTFANVVLAKAFRIDAAPGVLYRKVSATQALNENTAELEAAAATLPVHLIPETAITITVNE